MRIGIDARFLTHPQRGGFKSYTNAVINSLKNADSNNEYILYTDRYTDDKFELPANFRIKPVTAANGMIREQFVLPTAMRKDNVDLAHYLCNTAPLLPGPPMAVTILDAIPLRPGNNKGASESMKQRMLSAYWRNIIPGSAARAKLVITCTDFTRNDLISQLRIQPDKVKIIPLAIDPVFFDRQETSCPAEISPDEYYLLAFASSDPRKNHTSAIEAYRSIADSYPGLKLLMVCSHPDVKTMVANTAPSGVTAIGPVKFGELLWLYRNAQVMIFPSFDEGFGLPPLEAMASGTPVVASNASCMPEVLGDSVVYAIPSQPVSIADGIKQILSDNNLRTILIQRGQERAGSYTQENMGKALISAYREAFSGAQL